MRIAVLILASAALAGCAGMSGTQQTAEARLAPTQGNSAAGTVVFSSQDGGVHVEASISGLSPGGHGFHIHEKGDCSAPDATSAGGHFNPGGKPHGHPERGEHHAGDMPMLQADAQGNARLDTRLTGVALEGPSGIVGKAVIVHAAPDDFQTQPTGNAGGRLACGVITLR